MEQELLRAVIYNPARSRRFREDVLFIDTENPGRGKEITSVQLRYNGKNYVLTPPIDVKFIEKLWREAKAVVFHNALYDMGVLSTLPGNSWEWCERISSREKDYETGENGKFTYYQLKLFGFAYKVKRLSSVYSYINTDNNEKGMGNGTPVIDTVKLYDIFIDKESSLKKLAPKYLHRYMIPYSDENALTYEYQIQDVEALDGVYCHFMLEMESIDDVKDYTHEDWMKMNSTATCAKRATKKAFPKIATWRKKNEAEDKKFGLWNALESAYLGGLTAAMYHGTVKGVSVNDIKGSYDGVINHENMDQYNRYTWEKIEPPEELPENNYPILCKVWTDVVMKHMENSLKIFRLRGDERKDMVYWSYDILALKNLFKDVEFEILEAHRPIPLNPVAKSLAGEWNVKKAWAQEKYGKEHPLRNYYKTLSNASYGICAEKSHGRGDFTNMVKAGIITARARLTLSKMIKVGREMGCDWLYSDTDSVVCRLNGVDAGELEAAMKKAIYPYDCECEFVGDMRVISLKRYWGYNGKDLEGNEIKDKIRVHGRGRYNIDEEDLVKMLSGEKVDAELCVKRYAANTEITMKQVMKVNPEITNPHPFMFEKNVPLGKAKQVWFDEDWKTHIDSKTTFPEGACFDDEFEREFPTFKNYRMAEKRIVENATSDEPINVFLKNQVDWDAESAVMFNGGL